MVGYAQRAYRASVSQRERRPRVESYARLAGHQGIVGKPVIRESIGYLHHLVTQDDMRTEGLVAIGLAGVKTRARLEPLAVSVDQTHQGNGNIEQSRCDAGIAVESLLGLGVQHATLMECKEAPFFVWRQGRTLPAASFAQHPRMYARSGVLLGKGPDQPIGDPRFGLRLLLGWAFFGSHQHDRQVSIDCSRITTQGATKLGSVKVLQPVLQQD